MLVKYLLYILSVEKICCCVISSFYPPWLTNMYDGITFCHPWSQDQKYFRCWMELRQLWQFQHEKWGQNTFEFSVDMIPFKGMVLGGRGRGRGGVVLALTLELWQNDIFLILMWISFTIYRIMQLIFTNRSYWKCPLCRIVYDWCVLQLIV